jgi:DNA-directed RNA polymerase specialized sigma24 family protein
MTEVQMFGATKIRNQQSSPYATRADFCRIFQTDMNRLYLLSFLLTGDATMAEQCFVGGLHISQEGNQVFKEWAESWARRAIILNAIRMIRPRLARPELIRPRPASDNAGATGVHNVGQTAPVPAELAGIVDLPALERFVFVMSVLEHYSDQECSLLLGCTRRDVTSARSRALYQMGRAADLQGNVVSIGSDGLRTLDNLKSKLQPEIVSGLAASA